MNLVVDYNPLKQSSSRLRSQRKYQKHEWNCNFAEKENPLINNSSSQHFLPDKHLDKEFLRASVSKCACLNKLLLKALEYKWPFPHWVILSACRAGWDGGGSSSRDEKASWPPHKGLPVRGAMRLIIRHQTPQNSSVVFFFFCNQEEWANLVQLF